MVWVLNRGIISVRSAFDPAPSSPATTWDSANKSAGMSLSGSDLIATSSTNYDNVRAVAHQATGKYYWEIVITGNLDCYPGFCDASANIATGLPGFDGQHSVSYTVDGSVWKNGAQIRTGLSTWTLGDVLSFALDIDNKSLWVRKGSSNWNNSGSANPDTNTDGIDVSAVSTDWYAVTGNGASGVATANFGGSSFAQAKTNATLFGNW